MIAEIGENKTHKRLQEYLLYAKEDTYLDSNHLEAIKRIVLEEEEWSQHEGLDQRRLSEHNPREVAYHDEWVKQNQPNAGINYGHGVLQDLFFIEDEKSQFRNPKCHTVINERDRFIVATVIQWLGTNVGMSFLESALNKCGHRIEKK